MNRRYFFKALTSGLVAAGNVGLFLPKLVKPAWRPPRQLPPAPGPMFGQPLLFRRRPIVDEIRDEFGCSKAWVMFGHEITVDFLGPVPDQLAVGRPLKLNAFGFDRVIQVQSLLERRDQHGARFELRGFEELAPGETGYVQGPPEVINLSEPQFGSLPPG